jgi:radical SAM superfamily enzyme YgiQ (UPF0313 family)
MQNDLVYLVNVGNDPVFGSSANDASFPALGVLALGTWLSKTLPDIEIIVRDGQIISTESIVKEIEQCKPGLVACSVLATSYQNALKIAQAAKDSGAYTVFGNDQAAQLSKQILQHRPYVDFVLGSEYGERPLELLVRSLRDKSRSFADVPDLTYRENGEVKGFEYGRDKSTLSILNSSAYPTEDRKTALDLFPIVNRNLYPSEHWSTYLRNYLNKYSHVHQEEEVTGVTTMNRARGCSRAGDSVKCKFCDLLLDISFSSPKVFWQEVIEAYKQVRSNIFFEVCDSFLSFPVFIDNLVKEKPDSLDFNPKFFVYGQARDIVRKPERISKLRELGVFRVYIGLESGSDQTLKHMKSKYDSAETNYRALYYLREQNIYTYGSFVLGSDTETHETLRETVRWAKKVIKEGLLLDFDSIPLIPLPGNVYGKRLVNEGLISKEALQSDLPWALDELSKLYINTFSGVSYEDVIQAACEIGAFAKEHGIKTGSVFSSENKD